MNNLVFRFFKNYDWYIAGATILLVAIGLATLFSATTEYTIHSVAIKQSINAAIGIVGLLVLSHIDYRIYRSYTGVLYIGIILMLIAVKVFGFTVNAAQSWIDLGFFQLQPSTLAQLLLIIILGKYFSENYEEMHHLKAIIRSAIYMAIPVALIAWQPDFGSALVVIFIWAAMLLASNANRTYIWALSALGLVSLPVIWFFLAQYQKDRVLTFLNPTADPMGAGWNVSQSMIAVGSGQLWGRGLGHGTQSQLNFIPEKHTDFIFAMIAEEMGFLGVAVLLALYLLLFYRGFKVAIQARDFFGTYIAVGVLAMYFVHILINVGMNVGLMPVTGIPLPFISYGGTAIIVNLAGVGLLLSVHRRYKKIDF